MTRESHDPEVELKVHELLEIRDGRGLRVACVNGVIWITQSEDTRDVIVGAGESFILDRPGLALVAAPVGPATVTVHTAVREKRMPVAA